MADTKIYLPKQKVRRGVAGYQGKNIVVVDPATAKQKPAESDTEKKSAKKAE